MKKHLIVLTGLALLSFLSCTPKEPPMHRTSLKVMTLNIWSGLDYKGIWTSGRYESDETYEMRFQSLLRDVAAQNPDILVFNELNTPGGFLRRLKKELDYDVLFHVGLSGIKIGRVGVPWNLREGDAILAKRDLHLEYLDRIQLSDEGFAKNWGSFHTGDCTQAVLAKVTVNGETWYIAGAHLHASTPYNDRYRQLAEEYTETFGYPVEELQSTLTYLKENQEWRDREFDRLDAFLKQTVPKGAPLIVLGDFNAHDTWPEVKNFTDKGYTDTYAAAGRAPGYTWDPGANGNIQTHYAADLTQKHDTLLAHLDNEFAGRQLRLDYIFTGARPAKETITRSIVTSSVPFGGIEPSDHYGVMTVFSLD